MIGRKPRPTPLEGKDAVLADLDGVVYAGPNAIPHAVDALNRASESVRVGYITNNASRSDETVAAHLSDLGLHVQPRDIVTSPQAAMTLLADQVKPGARILVIGGDGLLVEVERAGFVAVHSADDEPDAVVQGFAKELGWTDLAEASFALAKDIPWVATNTDWTIPVERGIAPGNGTLVSAVHSAVGRLPLVAGKPEPAIFREAMSRFGSSAPLFIGDRLDTDIKGAHGAGIASVLVLTGIDGPKELVQAPEDSRPDFVLADLRGLDEVYEEPVVDTAKAVATCGKARVSITGRTLRIDRGEGTVEAVRALCALVWQTGINIYGLDIDENIFEWPPRTSG